MPILKHAKKKLRQDKKRTLKNKTLRSTYKSALKRAKENPTDENMRKAFSEVDRAAKHNIIHANKAARLKSALSKVKDKGGKVSETEKKSAVKKAPTTKKTTTQKAAKGVRKTASKKK